MITADQLREAAKYSVAVTVTNGSGVATYDIPSILEAFAQVVEDIPANPDLTPGTRQLRELVDRATKLDWSATIEDPSVRVVASVFRFHAQADYDEFIGAMRRAYASDLVSRRGK